MVNDVTSRHENIVYTRRANIIIFRTPSYRYRFAMFRTFSRWMGWARSFRNFNQRDAPFLSLSILRHIRVRVSTRYGFKRSRRVKHRPGHACVAIVFVSFDPRYDRHALVMSASLSVLGRLKPIHVSRLGVFNSYE